MTGHIVAGYDGSRVATAAARWAADEAQRRDAGLTVATVFTVPLLTDFGLPDTVFGVHEIEALRAAAQQRLDRLSEELGDVRPGLVVGSSVVRGRAREQLAALSERADLLVIGSSGSGESPLRMLGSLANSVTRDSACPVVLVPRERPMPEHPRLVAVIDATPDWHDVVDWASDEADVLGARLDIVHAWSYPYADPESPSEARDLTRIDAATHLDRAVERAVARSGADVNGLLLEGETTSEVVAATFAADLVAVGSLRYRLPRLVPTSTLTDAVIAHATCPIAVVAERRPG
jgi:nucleotide-binding universal stress UspA family protein